YFIMITLAFAQMVYYVAIGLDRYGGDDGLTIYRRSQFGDLISLSNRTAFYYLCLILLLASIYLVWRIVNSRFGMVIQGSRSNERRMRAIGFPTYRYRLLCFVIAGVLCGLAGVLLANHTDFISPAVMHWTRSGDLIVMVVLGGMGSVFGPVIGAIALLVLEELLPHLLGFAAYVVTGREVAAADFTALPVYRRSALGLARSFQITSLFPDFTALDNVALAVQAHAGHSFRFWRDARKEPELREPARAALARVGLSERADAP